MFCSKLWHWCEKRLGRQSPVMLHHSIYCVSHAPQTYHCLISCAVCAGYICCSFQNWATGSMAQSSMSGAQPVSVLHGGVPLRTSPTHSRLSSGRLFSRHGKTRIHTHTIPFNFQSFSVLVLYVSECFIMFHHLSIFFK